MSPKPKKIEQQKKQFLDKLRKVIELSDNDTFEIAFKKLADRIELINEDEKRLKADLLSYLELDNDINQKKQYYEVIRSLFLKQLTSKINKKPDLFFDLKNQIEEHDKLKKALNELLKEAKNIKAATIDPEAFLKRKFEHEAKNPWLRTANNLSKLDFLVKTLTNPNNQIYKLIWPIQNNHTPDKEQREKQAKEFKQQFQAYYNIALIDESRFNNNITQIQTKEIDFIIKLQNLFHLALPKYQNDPASKKILQAHGSFLQEIQLDSNQKNRLNLETAFNTLEHSLNGIFTENYSIKQIVARILSKMQMLKNKQLPLAESAGQLLKVLLQANEMVANIKNNNPTTKLSLETTIVHAANQIIGSFDTEISSTAKKILDIHKEELAFQQQLSLIKSKMEQFTDKALPFDRLTFNNSDGIEAENFYSFIQQLLIDQRDLNNTNDIAKEKLKLAKAIDSLLKQEAVIIKQLSDESSKQQPKKSFSFSFFKKPPSSATQVTVFFKFLREQAEHLPKLNINNVTASQALN